MNTNLPSVPNSRVEYGGEALAVRRLLTHTKKLHEILRRKRKLQFTCSFHMHRLQEGFILLVSSDAATSSECAVAFVLTPQCSTQVRKEQLPSAFSVHPRQLASCANGIPKPSENFRNKRRPDCCTTSISIATARTPLRRGTYLNASPSTMQVSTKDFPCQK